MFKQSACHFSRPHCGTTGLIAQCIGSALALGAPLWGKQPRGSQLSTWCDCWMGSCPDSAGRLWVTYTLGCSPGSANRYKVLLSSFKTCLGYPEHYTRLRPFYATPRESSRQNPTTHGHILLGRAGIMTALTLPPRATGSFSSPSACWHPAERYYTFLQEGFEPFFLHLFWGILQFLFLFSLADLPHFPSSVCSVPSTTVSSSSYGHKSPCPPSPGFLLFKPSSSPWRPGPFGGAVTILG